MKGLRYNKGKPKISLVLEATRAVAGCAVVLEKGANKYTTRYENEWEGLLAATDAESLVLYFVEDAADPATKRISVKQIHSLRKDNKETQESGTEKIKTPDVLTTENGSLLPKAAPWLKGIPISLPLDELGLQKPYIGNTLPLDVQYAAPKGTYILITTIPRGSFVEYCVVNTTTVLGSLETTLGVLRPHLNISSSVTLLERSGRNNWKQGLAISGVIDSMQRHVASYLEGEDNDQETGLPHVDHILCNALFISELYHTKRELCDDRTKGE